MIYIHPFALYETVTHIFLIPLTVYLVTKPSDFKRWIRDIATSYAGIWLLYGCLDWVGLQFGFQGNFALTSCALVLYLLSLLVSRIRIQVGRQIPVILCHKGKQMPIMAFCDTGNLLVDPYCNKPVHVISSEALTSFLKETGEQGYRLIPYETVSGKELMKSYTFDALILCKKTPVVLKNVVVGMAKNELFCEKSIQLLLNTSQLDI